ncbi:MAG: hypothetical protein Faunusvirus10_12 [Faunusvirus sp.]|jgi:hypothetical protein|uniref:Uncharacterized protein n=1 Tax=Faunusvirus sp. TaxID=2487766 RepID=A0A3G5A1H5_9VIRU|nr:MAG: hypothetical protein Faunusvirus10_12 [Faunusvirus sp.]
MSTSAVQGLGITVGIANLVIGLIMIVALVYGSNIAFYLLAIYMLFFGSIVLYVVAAVNAALSGSPPKK